MTGILVSDSTDRVRAMPNSVYVVNTAAGSILVHSPPETLKYLLAEGLKPPKIFLLPTDMPAGHQLGSSGFIRQGINYASVEFLMYTNFFGSGQKTQIITTTADQARRIRRYLDETIVGPENSAYGEHSWLQRECRAVGYYPPLKRELQTDDLITITNLETGGGKLEPGVEISLDEDHFVFSENGKIVAKISTTISGISTPLSLAPPRPLHRQEITLQFIGGSDGFDPAGITTCFLAYLGTNVQTQATLFDTAAYLRLRLGNLGISPSQISEVVLSHLHEDHLAGLPELLLMGNHRVRLLTSDIIYESLLRVLSALMAIPEKEVATLIEYHPLNPGTPVTIDNKRFESLYAVHSIPTISVRANSLYYSGDMRYDEEWFEALVKDEILTVKRRDELIHFADGASVLVQDVGGGAIHTTLTPALLKLLAAKGQRLVLAHTSKHLLPTGALADYSDKVEFAVSGHVTAIGEEVLFESSAGDVERVETLSACPLFARLSVSERIELAEKCAIVNWQDGDVIMHHGDVSDRKTYIIHSGLVNITSQGGKSLRTIGRGNSVGERGALQGEARSGTLIAVGPVQLLSLSADVFKPVAENLGLVQAFSRADWLAKQAVFAQLPWATLLDLALDFQPRTIKSGEVLFEFGEPGYECYLLINGAIDVMNERGELIEQLNAAGSFFGGRAALYNQTRNASARAATDTDIWALPASALQRLQMIYPQVLLHLRVVESTRRSSQIQGSETT